MWIIILVIGVLGLVFALTVGISLLFLFKGINNYPCGKCGQIHCPYCDKL